MKKKLLYIFLKVMKVLLLVGIFSFCLPSASFLFCEDDWAVLRGEEKVEVYQRGRKDNRYGEFRSVTEVDQQARKTYEVFRDFSTYSEWFGFCIESYQVAEHSPFHKTAFIGINAPWPVRDRYMIIEVYFDYDREKKKGTIVFSLSRKKYGIDPKTYDPMITVEGDCVIEEVGENRTKVAFTFINDPGGNVPKVFFNKFLAEQMVETANGLRRFVQEEVAVKVKEE